MVTSAYFYAPPSFLSEDFSLVRKHGGKEPIGWEGTVFSYQLLERLKMRSLYRLVGYQPVWMALSHPPWGIPCWPLSRLCRPGERDPFFSLSPRLIEMGEGWHGYQDGLRESFCLLGRKGLGRRTSRECGVMLGLQSWVPSDTGVCLETGASRPKGTDLASSSPSLHHLFLRFLVDTFTSPLFTNNLFIYYYCIVSMFIY